MTANKELQPAPVTSVSFRFAFPVGRSHRRPGSTLVRSTTLPTEQFASFLLVGALLSGCSTAHHAANAHQTKLPTLYLFWGAYDRGSAYRFLSAQIHLNEDILVGGDDFLELSGHIERRGTNLVADLLGSTGPQAQVYRGSMTLEKPFFAQGGAASGGAGPPFWFLVSTNWNCRTVLEHVNAVQGLTGQPFSHPAAEEAPPKLNPNAPTDIDPATGLPWNNRCVDPITGLPLHSKDDKK